MAQRAWPAYGGLAELVDALDLGSSAERRAGSSPVSPTNLARWRAPHRASGWQLHLQIKLRDGSVAQR